jgi:hypothetical protein
MLTAFASNIKIFTLNEGKSSLTTYARPYNDSVPVHGPDLRGTSLQGHGACLSLGDSRKLLYSNDQIY